MQIVNPTFIRKSGDIISINWASESKPDSEDMIQICRNGVHKSVVTLSEAVEILTKMTLEDDPPVVVSEDQMIYIMQHIEDFFYTIVGSMK